MKKLLVLFEVLVLAVSLCACRPAEPLQPQAVPQADPTLAAANEALSVALLLPGTIDDNGWNAGAHTGLLYLEDNYHAKIDYMESAGGPNAEANIRRFAEEGYDIIVCHGTQFADSAHLVALEYPETYFLISNAEADYSQPPNVACFGTVHSGFLAGAVAASVTETGTVAILGGEKIPSITPIVDLFIEGAHYVNPDVNVISGYIGSLTDADKAKAMAADYIDNGADVVCSSANSAGHGVIAAAAEKGVYAIGFNSDQYDEAPGSVIVSVVREFPTMFDTLYNTIENGNFEAKPYVFGIAEGGTVLSSWHGWDEKLPRASMQKINAVIHEFKAGKITIRSGQQAGLG